MSSPDNSSCSPHNPANTRLDFIHFTFIGISAFTIITIVLFGILWFRKYRSLNKTIQQLRQSRLMTLSSQDALMKSPLDSSTEIHPQSSKSKQSIRLSWKLPQQNLRVTKADLNLIQLIKAGKEGAFYKAKMMRGTCKGHTLVTCKIAKEGVSAKQMEKEVSIMRKLQYHKNVLQLLDWNTTEEPFMLIMEVVSYGTLRGFLQTHQEKLSADAELQSLFTIASYHIATAMEHLRSKMVGYLFQHSPTLVLKYPCPNKPDKPLYLQMVILQDKEKTLTSNGR